jgi:hypothetical protein
MSQIVTTSFRLTKIDFKIQFHWDTCNNLVYNSKLVPKQLLEYGSANYLAQMIGFFEQIACQGILTGGSTPASFVVAPWSLPVAQLKITLD